MQLLTPDQQRDYIAALRNGAPASTACNLVGVSYEAVIATEDADADFAEQTAMAGAILSQNAAAALYKLGLKGSVSALTFLLRNQPPPEWTRKDPQQVTDDDLDNMSDEELERLFERTAKIYHAMGGP
jgi:hypothetical protein